ncbi:MAG: hypothetical protein WBQ18_14065, partial [Solirubrobacteraceae bacterium]
MIVGDNHRRRVSVAMLSGLVFLLAVVGSAAAATTSFSAHGSAEQVYVTGLAPHARMSLRTARGHTVAIQHADSLGGLLFRNVKPGNGYRVRLTAGGAQSGPLTVLSNRPAPPSTAGYDQTLPTSGYGYL